jgi:GntR family transcriptional regulator of gluconate operon
MPSLPRLRIPKRTQLWESVLESMREAIVRGELAPGTHLLETELAEEFGVSRWPIRQAIARLEQEYLVITYPHRGAYVVGLSREDVEEIYSIRDLLEGYAVEQAAKRLQPEHLAQLEQLVEQMVESARMGNMQVFSDADMRFHQLIFEIAGFKRLLGMWQLLADPVRVLLFIGARREQDLVRAVAKRHRAVVAALKTRDPHAAKAAIQEHLCEAEKWVLGFTG